ncbi:type II toxin-antitoxin system VapC family toxin [Duganella radicis]|uniref:Ribonuclease VapC n=1 Tax=Duganella radicis TaxID=551988 RepID=A0A6L6PIL9_9BURK|nr:type II toxin-antitoxin system VapC family toxin [Duganella radicis]MTV38854.1 PIN domain-containing protein [Duganella radicis]
MILLDTHTLIWWFDNDPRLSVAAKRVIETELQTGLIGISSFSCWEVALLVSRRKIRLSDEIRAWLGALEALNPVRFIPVDNNIAVTSIYLPLGLNNDPADRIIVATAMQLNIPIVTTDAQIRAYPHVQTIW